MSKYREAPQQIAGFPPGVPYIIGNEAAERFSFYGMKGILTVFMAHHLLNAAGEPAYMSEEDAKGVYHLFTAAAYFFPLIGSLISDIFWGKYKTIIILSLGYCIGHGFLALMDVGPMTGLFDMTPFLFAGLIFVAIGAGGVKPCVSAHVGDQFGAKNQHLVSKIFSWFYFSINVGAMASNLLTPWLLANVGPWAAFGLPGVLMAVALFVFWLGRNRFVHVPPAGWNRFKSETFSRDGLRAVLNLSPIFLIFIPMFWAIFDQTGSAWVLQANKMDRNFLGMYWLEAQVQAVNPFLILVLIPFFAYVVYPFFNRFFTVTPLRKIGVGLFLTCAAFAISAWIEMRIEELAPGAATTLWSALGTTGEASANGLEQALAQAREAVKAGTMEEETIRSALVGMPGIGGQFLAYVVLTAAEVLVSITSLEFAYTQAPKKMKSFIMGIYFLGVSLGNVFTSGVNFFIQNDDGTTKLPGASYYWFFTWLMLGTAVVFVGYSFFYKGRRFVQGDDEAATEASLLDPELSGPEGEHGQHPEGPHRS